MNETNPTPTQQGETLEHWNREPDPCWSCGGEAEARDDIHVRCIDAKGINCEVMNHWFTRKTWNTRRAAIAGPQGVIELLSASLLHPESAEGYVRQAIQMLSAAATSSPAPADVVKAVSHWCLKAGVEETMCGIETKGLLAMTLISDWATCEKCKAAAFGYQMGRADERAATAPAERTRVEGEQEE